MLTSHDYYCRCRLCKPPLVGQASHSRLTMIAFALIAVGAVMVLR